MLPLQQTEECPQVWIGMKMEVQKLRKAKKYNVESRFRIKRNKIDKSQNDKTVEEE